MSTNCCSCSRRYELAKLNETFLSVIPTYTNLDIKYVAPLIAFGYFYFDHFTFTFVLGSYDPENNEFIQYTLADCIQMISQYFEPVNSNE